MADHKPPRFCGDDRMTLLALLQYQRDSFVRKMEGVDERQAADSPLPTGTSLLWLTNHMADAETTWVLRRFAGLREKEAIDPPQPGIADAVERYRRVWRAVDDVVGRAETLDAECRPFDDQPVVNLRWVLAHLLEETARHAGHADVLRELIDGTTGR